MATRNGKRPGRPPNPKYNLERVLRAVSKMLDDSFDSADKAEDLIGQELRRPDLTPADRLLAIAQMVSIVKYRTTMACEVIATFGKRRAGDILAEPDSSGGFAGEPRPSGSPFQPGDVILPTVQPDEEPP